MIKRSLMINGAPRMAIAKPDTTLATYLRESLGLTSVKIGCGTGQCGSCSVIVDGKVVRSCSYKMSRLADGAVITNAGRHRHSRPPAPPAGGMAGPRRRTVRFLLAGIHRFRQGSA